MELDDSEHAIEWFRKVVRRNPKYEMLFEAKMNMARMGSAGNAKEMYRMLNRMLDEKKNEEYIDRIYFAMAELAMREGNVDKAIGYYRESVANARTNQNQRVASSLKVATILFERNDYELSQAYYDTAVRAMNKETYLEYDSIANISNTLNLLVTNLTVIRNQDSLLMVANMDSISRNKLIDKIIADVIEQEQIAKEQAAYEEQLAMMGGGVGKSELKPDDSKTEGGWYFYNPTTLQNGYSDFSRKWGLRKLEDNWRISDKRSISRGISDNDFDDDKSLALEADSSGKIVTDHDREYYLQELPFSEEQQQESHKQIANALYNVGFIYLDRLSDYPRSIDAYERLDTRYPGNEHELPAWYALYKMYNDQKNTEKADLYKSRILGKYPESSYANFILDPDYYKKLKEESQQASELYTKTYEAYQQGQYYRVRMNAERALDLYASDTALAPRFALLDAVARGRLETVDSMAYALVKVVRDYPTSSIHRYALDLLQEVNEEYHLDIKLDEFVAEKDKEGEKKPESPYKYEPNTKHFVMVVFNPKTVKTEPLKVRITDFNKKQYRFKEFEMKNLLFDDTQALIYLSSFENEQEAKDYITSMYLTDYIFGGMDKTTYWVLPVSVGNFSVFCKERKIDEYNAFFGENSK